MNGLAAARRDGPETVQTVERGMAVIRAFRAERAALSNADLVRRTGLSKATVSRLTSTLLQMGFLRHAPGGRQFELGPGALGIGNAYVAANPLEPLVRPLLQDLAERLEVSVALALPDGLDVIYVGYRASRKVATLRLGLGSVLPVGTTAIGHAILWALPKPEQKRLVQALRERAAGQRDEFDLTLQRSFQELADAGTCAVLGQFQRGAYAAAAPVRVGRQRIVMGLSCGKASVHADLDAERRRLSPALLDTVARLESQLAGHDGRP
ncbi:MAG: IclR family transcriptional regulator [Rubrivivax sp.]